MAQVRVEGENRVPKRLKSPSKPVSGREIQHFWAKSRPPMIAAPFEWVGGLKSEVQHLRTLIDQWTVA